MKILFLHHLYVNAGMTRALISVSESVFCPDKAGQATPEGSRPMTWSEFRSLRRRILAREFGLVISYACQEALWRQNRPWLKNIVHAVRKILFYFPASAPRLLLPAIRTSGTPLVIYDYDDLMLIPAMRMPYLDVCQLYFKVHPPVNLSKVFLFQNHRLGNLWSVLRDERYSKLVSKIRPVSYGCDYEPYYDECLATEKKYDLFFTGGLDYSPVRQDGRKVLEELQAQGYRVCLPGKVPHREFLRLCSESWLVLSPEGGEWQSARHYESLLMKSVPLINYPTVRLQDPLLHGTHVFYYPPEGKLLIDVIKDALSNKERLIRMAEEGRKFVLQHHIHSQIVKYMLDEVAQGRAVLSNGQAPRC